MGMCKGVRARACAQNRAGTLAKVGLTHDDLVICQGGLDPWWPGNLPRWAWPMMTW